MWLSVGMDAALVLGPTNFLINSTPTQPCKVTYRMFLHVGMDAALVLGPTIFFNQLHPNPTLLSNGSDVVESWDGRCSCLGADKLF